MMIAKKKKQPKNAFYFFMIEYKRDQENKGKRFHGGMKEVAEKAAPIWKNMSTNERWVYEEEARKEKERDKHDLENKFTSQGISFAELEKEMAETHDRIARMNREIESTVRSLDYDYTLPTYPFHVIHINYYCRQENGIYTPCEIGLAEFNFADGVRKVYHTLIDPGCIPLGYKYEADKHSTETHQIPVPPDPFGGENDYAKILRHIRLFLTEERGIDSPLPPVYTQENCIDSVKNVLSKLQEALPLSDPKRDVELFRVYPLAKLFYELRNACVSKPDGVGFPAFTLAERELDKDVFNFTRGISCEFHEKTDALPYCSLSCVRRWSFVIMDHCCKDLGIDLIPGRHCPSQADTGRFQKTSSRPASVMGEEPPHSSDPWKKLNIVDHGKVTPDPLSGKHFTLGATPGVVTVSKQPEPKKPEPLAPLRPPKTQSLALSLLNGPDFSEEDFPAIGASRPRRPGGMGQVEPVAVGRGKLAAKLSNPVTLGRGRTLASKLEADFTNLDLN